MSHPLCFLASRGVLDIHYDSNNYQYAATYGYRLLNKRYAFLRKILAIYVSYHLPLTNITIMFNDEDREKLMWTF